MDKLNLIEAESLAIVVDEIRASAESGRMITAVIDSTTKKRVYQPRASTLGKIYLNPSLSRTLVVKLQKKGHAS